MKLYNTLSRSLEEFEPIDPPNVSIYTCGPTVYSDIHIGNFRTYLTTDILRRVLKERDYTVKSVMNITDVGHFRFSNEKKKVIDPIIEEAEKLGIAPLELSQNYTDSFLKDSKKLNIMDQDVLPKATEHIKDMIEVIKVLIERKYAYRQGGNVYFDVRKFADYGKLSGNTLDKMDQLLEAVRISVETDKKDSADFALWKKADDRMMSWDSPWGKGVPGWHIECSVMGMKYLGVSFDIHLGGEDLIFPHHDDEIAQSEAFSKARFSRYFLHTSYLTIDNEKMSRSKGNIYTLKDLRNRGFSPLAFRYLTYQTHYRTGMNFTWTAIESAQAAIDRLYEFATLLPPGAGTADKYEMDFLHALSLDLNMPNALAAMWELVRSNESDNAKAAALSRMDEILGLNIFSSAKRLLDIPSDVQEMVEERNKLRAEKKFHLSDQMRIRIEKRGYMIEDKEKKTKILRRI